METGQRWFWGTWSRLGLSIALVTLVADQVHKWWMLDIYRIQDRGRVTIALLAAVAILTVTAPATQFLVIAAGGAIGFIGLRGAAAIPRSDVRVALGRRAAIAGGFVFFGLLVVLPLLRTVTGSQAVAVVDTFYRTGALVFGGGHVVLPLLEAEVVPNWMDQETFLAGYGAAQAVPGPLFTFAAYVGTGMAPEPNGIVGGTLALVAIFLPAFLLTMIALPSWGALRGRADLHGVLRGVNAAVVGILLAALYDPVATNAILTPLDAALGVGAIGLLGVWRVPPWLVVLLTAAGGALTVNL